MEAAIDAGLPSDASLAFNLCRYLTVAARRQYDELLMTSPPFRVERA